MPVLIISKISRLNVLNVVSPPKNPTVIHNLRACGITSILLKVSPKIYPSKKHPKIFTKKVPKIADVKYFLDKTEQIYLNTAPIPPPKNIDKRCIYNLTFLIILAGTPATTVFSGTSFVTTAFAPIIAPSPIVIPCKTVAFDPIQTLFPIFIGFG